MAKSVGHRTRSVGDRSSPLKWAFGVAALALLAAAGGVSVFYYNPVGIGMLLARQGLDRSGLERRLVEGPQGRVVYWTGGVGEPVVLLHGMGNQAGSWVKMAADIAVLSRVILPDLPGHGDSDPAAGPLTLDDMVSGIAALVDEESPEEPVTLMGNALGGWAALKYAAENPQRVRRLILLNSFASTRQLDGIEQVPQNREQALRLVQAMSPQGAPTPAYFVLDDLIDKITGGASPRVLAGLRPEDALSDSELAGIQVPVEILWGTEDEVLPLAYGQSLAQRLPRARLFPLEHCGHIPQQQCPREVVKRLVDIFPPGPQVLPKPVDVPGDVPGDVSGR